MKSFLFTTAVVFAFLLAFAIAAGADGQRPNIVLMMGDDHGWEETGYHGHPHVKTPVLDEIAATGLRFERFYAAHPSCSPTRASFLTGRLGGLKPRPYIAPELQEGTTPLVKLMAGKATRDFRNFHQPPITEADYLGPRAIIAGHHKLVIHEQKNDKVKRELFDLTADPAEEENILDQQTALAEQLQAKLRDWQQSVLDSLSGADYR